MLKSTERKSTSPAAICYEEAPNPNFGIAFEKQDGTKRFVPYAFLAALDFDGCGELAFTFSSCTVGVRGVAIDVLWRAACKGELARVLESKGSPDSTAAWVREIVFSTSQSDTAPDLPPFPRVP